MKTSKLWYIPASSRFETGVGASLPSKPRKKVRADSIPRRRRIIINQLWIDQDIIFNSKINKKNLNGEHNKITQGAPFHRIIQTITTMS